ncbi:MAG: hydantoinase/oxoprolinase family protein [Candidatus Tectomicrobia bacterium]|nr:hydantoinase/oxoprolinase family protein [Candidatus Tectomicrobia bacterium]
MPYIIGVDVGGTFTDAVLLDEGGSIALGKALSTPYDFSVGVLNSVRTAAEAVGLGLEDLMAQAGALLLGTTAAENAVITGRLARVGLLATRGFEDTLVLTRGGYGRWAGLSGEEAMHPVMTDKPPPIVPRTLTRGVCERADSQGEIVVPLDEEDAERAVRALVGMGVESLGVCFLWSFRNAANENRMAEIIREHHPGVPVTLSSELAPRIGEYERISTVALNAALSPEIASSLRNLEERISRLGFKKSLLVMQGYGGLLSVPQASARAVGLIESGPAGGIIGSQFLGRLLGLKNVIGCDLGGTSFKVGVITEGAFDYAWESTILRYHSLIPKIDIVSIGAGGGSIVWVEPRTNLPRIGPRSAGSSPGPVCYDLGGTEPTLTDVNLILGYLEPDYFLGGRMRLNVEKAHEQFRKQVAEPLGMEVEAAASSVYRLVNAQMADLVRKVTVERGLDPRDYVLFAYGGAAAIHASAFAPELGVQKVVVPATASVNGAFGIVTSDVTHEYPVTKHLPVPADAGEVNAVFADLEEKAREELRREGFAEKDIRLHRSVGMRFRLQMHEVITPILVEGRITPEDLEETYRRFADLYEQKHGKGSAYKEAGMEIISFQLRAVGRLPKPALRSYPQAGPSAEGALIHRRQVSFDGQKHPTGVYRYDLLECGNEIRGPAIILTPVTTIVIQPGQKAAVDAYKNVILPLKESAS